MRISDRYIGKQVLNGTVYAILVLSLVLVLGNIFKQIRTLLVDQAAPLSLVGRFVLNLLPFSLMFTIPWGFLCAVLLSFGRLSTDQEITAFRVAGMSLPRLAAPVFAIGIFLTGICLYINLNVVPQAKSSLNDLVYEQIKRDPRALLAPGSVQSRFANQKVFVESRDGDILKGFHYYEVPSDKDSDRSSNFPTAYVHAGSVSLVVDQSLRQLRLKLSDSYIVRDVDGKREILIADEAQPGILDFGARDKRARSATMTNSEIRQYLVDNPTLSKRRQVDFSSEITKRFSFSMACLAFAFVAVPLGLKARRKDTSTGLVMSLLIGAGYFLFTVVSTEFKSDTVATIVLWLPNVLCVVTGLWLFRRARFK